MRENRNIVGVTARLKPGVTIGQAGAEVKLIEARLAERAARPNSGASYAGRRTAPSRRLIVPGAR